MCIVFYGVTGKKVMAKCRMLIQENQELGRQLSQGRVAQLEVELALQKKYSDELKEGLNGGESWKNWPPLRGLPTDPTPRTTLRTTPRTTLRTSPRTTMRTTLTNQPNLLSRRKELEEAYLPTRSHLINSRHLDFRHFTRPSSPLASPQSSSATSQSTPFSNGWPVIVYIHWNSKNLPTQWSCFELLLWMNTNKIINREVIFWKKLFEYQMFHFSNEIFVLPDGPRTSRPWSWMRG